MYLCHILHHDYVRDDGGDDKDNSHRDILHHHDDGVHDDLHDDVLVTRRLGDLESFKLHSRVAPSLWV